MGLMTMFGNISVSSFHCNVTPSPTQANKSFSPAILYNSVVNKPGRAAYVKNTTMFYKDLKDNKLPQWMFITPNMTSDAHDTSVTVAGVWLQNFLGPLLEDKNFMQNTLILITFDENGASSQAQNFRRC
jgi:phospholipase C